VKAELYRVLEKRQGVILLGVLGLVWRRLPRPQRANRLLSRVWGRARSPLCLR